MMNLDALFAPLQLKNLTLRNRFVMSSMSRYSSPGRMPDQRLVDYFRRRAEGDVGLIMTGAAAIDRPAANNSEVLADFRPVCYPGWKRCIDAVHDAQGVIGLQLWHAGGWFRIEPDYRPAPLESPSGLARPDVRIGGAMSERDIADVIGEFGRAAAAARYLGFDAIEIHAAHGYLLDQFFWEGTNRRADAWGGATIRERVRFAVETIREVRRAIGDNIMLSIRISQWKEQDYAARIAPSPAELEEWVGPLADAGVDMLNCSQRRFWEPEFEGSDLNFAGWVKKLTGKPTATCGSVGLSNDVISFFGGETAVPTSLDELVRRVERGDFDLVAVGRSLLADPDWVRKVGDGTFRSIDPFDKSKADHLY